MAVLLKMYDGLRNVISGVQTGKDKATGWRHVYSPLNQMEIDAAYASDWLARKIVDIVPEDMTREWRTWQMKQSEKVYNTEKQLMLRSKVADALTLARKYGGSAIYIGTPDRDPREPLDLERLGIGQIVNLHVFSRFDLGADGAINDITSPDFRKPAFYTIRTAAGDLLTVHRSRFAFFCNGRAGGAGIASDGWGLSIFESVMQAITNVNATAANAAALTEEAKVDVISVPDLSSYLADEEGAARLTRRFNMANTLKSTVNMLLLGDGEKFDRKQVTFTGLTDLMHTHMELASAAADIPVTRLMGQSPAGLNSTGESDIRNYYDHLRSKQTTDLQDALRPLDEAIVRHTLGNYDPVKMSYEWEPLWALSDNEKADIDLKKAQTVQIYTNSGLFSPTDELRPAVTDMIVETGFLPSLDQYIMSDDEFGQMQEEEAQAALEQAQLTAQPQEGATTDELPFGFTTDDLPGKFEEAKHPRGPAGKFTEKYVDPGPFQGGTAAYQIAGSVYALRKRMLKYIQKAAGKNPPYRWYAGKIIEEAKHYNHPDVTTLIPQIKTKIGEGFLAQAKELASKGDHDKAKKLIAEAAKFGVSHIVLSKEPDATPPAAATPPINEPTPGEKLKAQAKQNYVQANTLKEHEKLVAAGQPNNPATLGKAKANVEADWFNLPISEQTKWAHGVPPKDEPKPDLNPAFENLHPRGEGGEFAKKEGQVESTAKWTQSGPKKGSNPGGFYKDEKGVEWYVKTPKTDDHVRHDLLANAFYVAASLGVPEEKAVLHNGKLSVASKIVEGKTLAQAGGPTEKAIMQTAAKQGFAVDAWLGNRDSIGLENDNIMITKNSDVIRIDQGGTFKYRAQGDIKEFGPKVGEFDSLRDSNMNAQAAAVFGSMSNGELVNSINRVIAISDQKIQDLVKASGVSEPDQLTQILIDRKQDLIERKAQINKSLGITTPAAVKPVVPLAGTTSLPPEGQLTLEQKKTAKTTPYPSTNPDAKYFTEWNAKWAGKQITTMEQLNQKAAEFKAAKVKAQQEVAKPISGDPANEKLQTEIDKLLKWDPTAADTMETLAEFAGSSKASEYLYKATSKLNNAPELKTHISPSEAAFIFGYTTSDFYDSVNAKLREGFVDAKTYKYAETARRIMKKLPSYVGPVKRKTSLTPAQLANYEPGRVFEWKAFSSAHKPGGHWSGNTTFHINSKTAKDVVKISNSPGEAEVIFAPKTTFVVRKKVGNEVWLDELEHA